MINHRIQSPNCQQQKKWFPHLEGSEVGHPRAGSHGIPSRRRDVYTPPWRGSPTSECTDDS